MAKKSKFVENRSQSQLLGSILSKTTKVVSAVKAKSEEAQLVAKSIAPVDEGDYRDSIVVDTTVDPKTGKTIGRVYATDYKTNWIEFGTSKGFPAFAVFRRATEAVGGTLVKRRLTK